MTTHRDQTAAGTQPDPDISPAWRTELGAWTTEKPKPEVLDGQLSLLEAEGAA